MAHKIRHYKGTMMGFFSAIKKFFGQESDEKNVIIKECEGAESLVQPAAESAEPADAGPIPIIEEGSEPAKENDEVFESRVEDKGHVAVENAGQAAGEIQGFTKEQPPLFPDDEGHGFGKTYPETGPGRLSSENWNKKGEISSSAASMEKPLEEKVSEAIPGDEERKGQARASAGIEKLSPEDEDLLARLREAEPRLSAWLAIVLEGVDEAGDELWKRLGFLLRSLHAPPDEVDAFIGEFVQWLERMEYVYVDEFRSELQYRLALALDLEDEEDERNRLLLKLSEGLARTREQLGRHLDTLFAKHGQLDDSFWEEMEELFIMADLGYEPSIMLVERLKERARKEKVTEASEGRHLLLEELEEIFRQPRRISAINKPEVILMIGVNGVGKTTTIAKLAHRDRMNGKKTLIVAADTFRAAAIEQLQVWAKRVGSEFYAKKQGADPASVAWEAMEYARNHDIDTVYIDTAGRLQTKVNLMEELGKIRAVAGKKHPGAPHRSILVLDATTGQNALSQAKLFKESAGVDELILTKLDGTAKGGVAISVAMQENLPITYVGLGEKMEDLRPFNGDDYARALLGETNQA